MNDGVVLNLNHATDYRMRIAQPDSGRSRGSPSAAVVLSREVLVVPLGEPLAAVGRIVRRAPSAREGT